MEGFSRNQLNFLLVEDRLKHPSFQEGSMAMEKGFNFNEVVEKNVPLAEHCSYKIGGEARFLAQPKSLKQFWDLVNYCQKAGLGYYIFGLGSNILFPDNPDQNTLFISLKKMVNWKQNKNGLFLEAGFPLSYLAFSGQPDLAFTHLLPGTLGASIYINARCYEGEMSQILEKVYYFDLEDRKGGVKELSTRACHFDYKKSVFQDKPWVILGADLKVGEIDHSWWKEEIRKTAGINMADLGLFSQYFGKEVFKRVHLETEQKEKLQQIAADRDGKKHFDFPSCGSVFKNNYEYGVPTGILVDKLGLKGLARGGAKISPYHGNFIINFDGAKASDVIYLIQLVQDKVNEKFGFTPEPEVVIVNGKPG